MVTDGITNQNYLINKLKIIPPKNSYLHGMNRTFVFGSIIQDNTIMAHEIIHLMGKKQGKISWLSLLV